MAIKEFSICLIVLVVALTQAAQHQHAAQPHPGYALKTIAQKRNVEYFQEKRKRGVYWIRRDWTKGCKFKGYAPNGPIASVGEIKAPKATLDAKNGLMAVMAGPLKTLGKVAGLTMHLIKFSGPLMAACPALAPALGVFSAVMGLLKGPEPSAQDILNNVNKAIADLTDEVNKKMKEMENYVDSAIAKTEKKLITAEYTACFRLWASCVKAPKEEESNRCQRDSMRHIVSKRPKFAVEADKLDGEITMKQVRRLEAYMLSFRDYANLVVMQLSTLTNYYCLTKKNADSAPHYCQQYADELITEATFLINYAEKAIAAIKRGHWGKNKAGPCPETFKIKCWPVKEGWGAFKVHTFNQCKCTCELLNANKKEYCEIGYRIRVDGKGEEAWYPKSYYDSINGNGNHGAASNKYGKDTLFGIARDYQIKNHKIMDKYWDQEVLQFVKEWKKAPDMAKEMKTKNPKGDVEPVLDEGFSPMYLSRLAEAGYTYSDLKEEFETQHAVEAQERVDEDHFVEADYPQEFEDDSDQKENGQDESNKAEFARYKQ